MAKIEPELNLNRNPQTAKNHSLVMAHNIAVDEDKIITPDYSIKQLLAYDKDSTYTAKSNNIVGVIVGVNQTLYIFKYEVVNNQKVYSIVAYNENTESTTPVKCAWTYHGGEITGNVTINNTNEIILNVCESNATEDVPIKHINLSKCSEYDDESIYTQAPNIPITNFYLKDTYTKQIPNGVYQFFVRYRIRDEFYTTWFPCSKECFAGNGDIDKTIQGQIKYIKTNRDASKSFIFRVQHLFNKDVYDNGILVRQDYTKLYKDFQVGFLLTTDNSSIARSWKSFGFNTNYIYFDYEQSAIKEIDINDLLDTNYELFNVKNITYFKNKLYIANYKETDFNPDLAAYAKKTQVQLVQKALASSSGTIYIDSLPLSESFTPTTSEGTSLGTFYKKWGSNNVSDLFAAKNLVNRSRNESKETNIPYNSESTAYGALTMHLYFDYGIDADVAWINRVHTSIGDGTHNNPTATTNIFSWLNTIDFGTNWRNAAPFTVTCDKKKGSKTLWTSFKNNGLPFSQLTKKDFTGECTLAIKNFFGSASGGGCPNAPLSHDEFWAYDDGFGGYEEYMSQETIKNGEQTLKECYYTGEHRIIAVYVQDSSSNKYYIYGSEDHKTDALNFEGTIVDDRNDDVSINQMMVNKIEGVDENGYFCANFGTSASPNYIKFNEYSIVYSSYEYDCSNITPSVQSDKFDNEIIIHSYRTNYNVTMSCAINTRFIKSSLQNQKQYNTLMPFTDYEFFIHYVKQNGIATNGYHITGDTLKYRYDSVRQQEVTYHSYADACQLVRFDATSLNSVIYPRFTNINIPDGYVAAFISVYKCGNDIAKCFNHVLKTDGYHYADCLEADALLYNIKEKIVIINSNGVELTDGGNNPEKVDAEYYSSSDYDPVEMLGNSGCIRWPKNDTTDLIAYGNLTNVSITYSISATKPTYGTFVYESNGIHYVDFTIPAGSTTAAAKTIVQQAIGRAIDSNPYFTGLSCTEGTGSVTFTVSTQTVSSENKISFVGGGSSNRDYFEAHQKALLTKSQATYPIVGDELWVKINNKDVNNKDRQLIKITPYLAKHILNYEGSLEYIYYNYEDVSSPGYLCRVYKPNRDHSNDIYCSGTDIYTKDTSASDTILLELLYDKATLKTSTPAYIYSNFNLNYVSLNDTLNAQVRSFKYDEDGMSYMQIIKCLNSLTASFMLTLVSMYKEFQRKYYYAYDSNKKTQFDNTIRSSDTNTDEIYRNIYRFYAEDYYNIPVNRGPIVNMFGITNDIYVHTEHSLFKFAGNNTLTANEGEVSLKESNVFDTGVSEVFDAQNGYAGLTRKNHALLTFNFYLFWDAKNNQIFAYDNKSGIQVISTLIAKLLYYIKPIDVIFAEDNRNNRFFINLICEQDNVVLSYNFNTKSFVSVHDFDFRFAVSSRTNSYFVQDTDSKDYLFRIDYEHHLSKVTSSSTTTYYNYDFMYSRSKLLDADMTSLYVLRSEDSKMIEVPCGLHILFTDEYEKIKVLNEISWICSHVDTYLDSNNIKFAEEQFGDLYPGDKCRIYTDKTYSQLKDLTLNGTALLENNEALSSNNNYEYIRHNNGVFTMNFFQDVQHDTIDFNDTARSLVYGKYFVFKIVFTNKVFKIENVFINYQNYEKV